MKMKQQVEIEFKNLLTAEEFKHIKQVFHVQDSQFIYQENHYFDTPGFSLKEKEAALRIRVKNDTYTLTLKQSMTQGVLETHERLTKEEALSLLNGTSVITGEMASVLQTMGIPLEQLQHFGTLTTRRAELPYEGGILVLDHSQYLQTDDYEIEYETNDAVRGKQVFEQLLSSLNIPIRPTMNKIKRLYIKKYGVEKRT